MLIYLDTLRWRDVSCLMYASKCLLRKIGEKTSDPQRVEAFIAKRRFSSLVTREKYRYAWVALSWIWQILFAGCCASSHVIFIYLFYETLLILLFLCTPTFLFQFCNYRLKLNFCHSSRILFELLSVRLDTLFAHWIFYYSFVDSERIEQ